MDVISPNERLKGINEKTAWYAAAGVARLLQIDPRTATWTLFTRAAITKAVAGADGASGLRSAAIVFQPCPRSGASPLVNATQIMARDHLSMVTRGKKVRHWQRAIAAILHVLLQIDRIQPAPRIAPSGRRRRSATESPKTPLPPRRHSP